MSIATLSDLPNELMQEIINYIPPTKNLTFSLSLISRSWFIYLRSSDTRFTCVYLHSRNVLQFLGLLRSPLCTFRGNVHRLHLDLFLGRFERGIQEAIHAIFTNLSDVRPLPNQANHAKSSLMKIKHSVSKFLTPGVKECQLMNIVCLFPHLEHLQFQLMGIETNIVEFPAQPSVSPSLQSVSVVCNSSPPRSDGKEAYFPPEWKRLFKWVRSNRIYTIRNLYLTYLARWNYRAAEMLVALQGVSLKHLHLGLENSYSTSPYEGISLDANLDSLHLEISDPKASAIALDILCKIPPGNLVNIGLDTAHTLIRDSAEVETLKIIAEVLKTRGFTKLRRIHIRMEYDIPKYTFAEAVQILRGVFQDSLLTVESIPYERRNTLRDATDDCIRI
ncbi:hypothetical protein BDZ94DRAFT_1309308 [Collybia nuda]|uniref:F-box domain-containing protein n=1 Tax=Collybia nuda TaxID=64659 RepID=A0A9P6CHY3_9AGAR|nr:hypothetical protein BDZ94DRAFT_1309308 [Collybia nuda]